MEEEPKAPGHENGGVAECQPQEPQKDSLAAEENESLRAILEEEKGKADNYLKNWQRAQADFINYKRRIEQERAEQIKFANATLILKVLPILDDFERAFANLPHELATLTWLGGIAMIERKLRFVLEQEGVTPIDAMGKDFDPLLHEAVLFEEGTDLQHGKVVAELQKGYKLHDRVIRPTLVKVGQPTDEANAKKAETEESTGSGHSAAS